MMSRLLRRTALLSLHSGRSAAAPSRIQIQRRTLVAAPKPGDGPLMERRPDRELPNVQEFRWIRTLPVFLAIIAASSVAIFNYQKLSSPVVASALYALRTSPRAREVLGDEIYFRRQIPWIAGEMDQLHGRIDVRFGVRGTRGEAVMRFASFRPTPRGAFETAEWSLERPDGTRVDLLEGGGGDPFRGIAGYVDDDGEGGGGGDGGGSGSGSGSGSSNNAGEEKGSSSTRGFRQQIK
ncbi:DUF1783-domain-containing protein [Biscogniauxia marginata]|nr:DUF1783-domain-containing protein [Biscogniauxia marginata]